MRRYRDLPLDERVREHRRDIWTLTVFAILIWVALLALQVRVDTLEDQRVADASTRRQNYADFERRLRRLEGNVSRETSTEGESTDGNES